MRTGHATRRAACWREQIQRKDLVRSCVCMVVCSASCCLSLAGAALIERMIGPPSLLSLLSVPPGVLLGSLAVSGSWGQANTHAKRSDTDDI